MSQNPAGCPGCYGKHWDANAIECRGGNDPSYQNPGNGTNKRDICAWYQMCCSATNRTRMEEAVRVAPPPPPPQPMLPTYPNQQPVYAPQGYAPQQGYRPAGPPVMPPAPQQAIIPVTIGPQQYGPTQQVAYVGSMPYTNPACAHTPLMVPMNMPMQGSQIPSFLTVPEPADPNVSPGLQLWRTVYRNMIKAACAGCAGWIDYNPIGRYPAVQPPR